MQARTARSDVVGAWFTTDVPEGVPNLLECVRSTSSAVSYRNYLLPIIRCRTVCTLVIWACFAGIMSCADAYKGHKPARFREEPTESSSTNGLFMAYSYAHPGRDGEGQVHAKQPSPSHEIR
jgi:hypothetical protein